MLKNQISYHLKIYQCNCNINIVKTVNIMQNLIEKL